MHDMPLIVPLKLPAREWLQYRQLVWNSTQDPRVEDEGLSREAIRKTLPDVLFLNAVFFACIVAKARSAVAVVTVHRICRSWSTYPVFEQHQLH